MSEQVLPLADKTIAVPETRQLDVFAGLLERRGAAVFRCPLVAILDAPNPLPVAAWIARMIDSPPEIVVFYTGEGVRRLASLARQNGVESAFVEALRDATILCRGPKPSRALHELGLNTDLRAEPPTTAGIIATIASLNPPSGRIGVQLFSPDPVPELTDFFVQRGIAADYVSPYVYASEADDQRVNELIDGLSNKQFDAIAFTSKSQVDRLFRVAAKIGAIEKLETGLRGTKIAAVGPIVSAELRARNFEIEVEPDVNFSLKPLVTKLCETLGN